MLQHGQSPYPKSLKVKDICHGAVINYRNDRQVLNDVIAAATQTEVHNLRCAEI
jgi:hypothetical protein